jgi:CheY-like chemotaxis protein
MNDVNKNTADKNKIYLLVVDLNVDDRFSTSMLLQQYGYNVCTASSTTEAISFMHVALPSVIVSEGGIGLELASRLKKDFRFSNIPIIVLSHSSDLENQLGKVAFSARLNKPVESEKLYQAVQAALGKNRRKNIRIETALLAKLDGVEVGVVSVLSEYGMFFPTKAPLPLNTIVTVELEIRNRTVKLEAMVLYSVDLDTSPFMEAGMGLKFMKINPDDHAFIRSYLVEQIK